MTHTHTHTHTQRERERERERNTHTHTERDTHTRTHCRPRSLVARALTRYLSWVFSDELLAGGLPPEEVGEQGGIPCARHRHLPTNQQGENGKAYQYTLARYKKKGKSSSKVGGEGVEDKSGMRG